MRLQVSMMGISMLSSASEMQGMKYGLAVTNEEKGRNFEV
jgi:hypothetical protein